MNTSINGGGGIGRKVSKNIYCSLGKMADLHTSDMDEIFLLGEFCQKKNRIQFESKISKQRKTECRLRSLLRNDVIYKSPQIGTIRKARFL